MKKDIALKIENVSKQYRLGLTGTGTLSDDLNRWWHKIRGKEDPYATVGVVNDRSVEGGDYVWAIKDINIEVKKGEILGIIGKNGAGKSTLLKILSRITGPTTGEITMNGRMASLLEVGTGFHPELTGRENIFLNGAILGMTKSEIKDKLEEIVDFSGCTKYVDTPVKRYSSGMRVRLGFAVAAFLEPDILVVDEVLAVGDAEFQKKAIGKMKEISGGGERTVLFVSHNMVSIRNLCTKAVILENGAVIYQGEVENCISKYLSHLESSSETNFPVILKDITIHDFVIENNSGDTVKYLNSGENCNFKLKLSKTINSNVNLNVRLQIFNNRNDLISTLNTRHKNVKIELLSQDTKDVICHLKKLNLVQGEFYIGIKIVDEFLKIIYENEKFYSFSIEAGDFFNSGKIPSSNALGNVFLNHDWI